MSTFSIVSLVLSIIWAIVSVIIACATSGDDHPIGMTDDRLYAWIWGWPVLVTVKVLHTIKLGVAELRRACRTEI